MSRSGPQATPSGALSLERAPARVAPRATYRLQLGPRLTFDGARELLPYLAELGISHLYLSPIMQARVGSTHGYDVIDPTVVSRELGGEAGFRALASAAHDAGIGVIVAVAAPPSHRFRRCSQGCGHPSRLRTCA